MSNFSEKEKSELLNEVENSPEEFSTIFSDPTAHKKTAENTKSKKRLTIVIASFLAVAVLVGGTVSVIKLIPEKQEEEVKPVIEDITVLDKTSDDFKSVTVTNANGTFKFYSETVYETETTTSSDSTESEEDKGTTTWYLEGYKKEHISSSSVESTVTTLGGIVAKMEITELTATDCGLDKPVCKADFVPKEGESFSVLVGNENVDKVSGGYYIKLSNSDKIYLSDSSFKSGFEFTAFDFAETDSLPYFEVDDSMADYKNEDGNISTFDTITVTGKNFPKPVVIEPNTDEELSSLAGYIITAPTKRIAENITTLFDAFQKGIIVSGVYSFDTSAASLKAVGLDNPDFVATMKIKNKTLTYKFALQEDGNYAAIADGETLIKMVSASNIPFAAYSTNDFYSTWVCLNSIDDLKSLVINTPDKTYEFGIKANPDEEADDKYIVTYNGTAIDCQSFQDFYQVMISITCTDFTVDNASGNPDYSFIFNFKDEIGGNNRIDFIKSSDTRYEYKSDGVALGKVNSSAINKIIKELEKLVG